MTPARSGPHGRAHGEQRDAAGAGLKTRRVALQILQRVEDGRAFADVMLGQRMGELANPADRRLLTLLVLGTIAWQGRLDYELAGLVSRKLDELDPEVRRILRLGVYQLRHLSRIPAHAAVDTSVRLAREVRAGSRVSRLVNAVLRAATRRPVELPPRSSDELEYLVVAYSHPRWLVERFIRWFGVEGAEPLMAANNDAAPNTLRLNLERGRVEELLQRLRDDGLSISSRGLFAETVTVKGAPLFDSPSYRAGLYTAQAEASQLVARLLAPTAGATVVDCAAAPGGKATHLAELVGPQGRVIALDTRLAGLKQARDVAARLRDQNILFARCDTAVAIPLRPETFRYVLLDAPCTGLGTLREHPEIRWRLRPADFPRMAELQGRMLESAAALVTGGGYLVYSICSFAPEEGELLIRDFLSRRPEFVVDAAESRATPLAELIDADGFMRTRPDRGGRDGFFAARLRKRS